jgi:hypothetical protein
MVTLRHILSLFLIAALLSLRLGGAEAPAGKEDKPAADAAKETKDSSKPKGKDKEGEEKLVETKHKVSIGGKEIAYTASGNDHPARRGGQTHFFHQLTHAMTPRTPRSAH